MKQTCKADRQTDREIDRHIDRQTHRQTDRETDRVLYPTLDVEVFVELPGTSGTRSGPSGTEQ